MTAQEAYEAALDAQKAIVYDEIENATKQGCFTLNVPDEEITPYVYRNLLRDGFMVEKGTYKEKKIAIIKWEYSIKWETKGPHLQEKKDLIKEFIKEASETFSEITKDEEFEVEASKDMKDFFKKHIFWFNGTNV